MLISLESCPHGHIIKFRLHIRDPCHVSHFLRPLHWRIHYNFQTSLKLILINPARQQLYNIAEAYIWRQNYFYWSLQIWRTMRWTAIWIPQNSTKVTSTRLSPVVRISQNSTALIPIFIFQSHLSYFMWTTCQEQRKKEKFVWNRCMSSRDTVWKID